MSTAADTAPLTYRVEHVELERFENLVYSRQTNEAGEELLLLLKRLKSGGEFAGHVMNERTRPRLYTRLAAAITALLTDPVGKLSEEGFESLAAEHATLHSVFGASMFGNADHLVRQFSEPDSTDPARIQVSGVQNLMKLLLSYSLDSEFEIDFETLLRLQPQIALPAVLGMLAHMVVLAPAAHRRRERLLALGPSLEATELKGSMLTAAQRVYMHCSYATGKGKHEIKASLNLITRRLIERLFKLPDISGKRSLRARPTILVPVEWFHSGHAMYRCYAPVIGRLREKFRLVVMGHAKVLDEVAKQLFDEAIELHGTDVMLSDALDQVARVNPDVIYYPSIGMAWCVALSTLRLAPVQIATMGHPATTKSQAIDYVIVPECGAGDPSCFSETVLLGQGMPTMVTRLNALVTAPAIEHSPPVLRIAVPAMVCKLNAPFLAVCRSIQEKSKRPVEFHFFPDIVALDLHLAARQIEVSVPGAVVHPRLEYLEYMARLGRCHLHLSPFPFGGTNSNIDSIQLGIPIVVMEGLEPHSQFEPAMMRHAGSPESLIAHDPAGYESIALRLIGDDDARVDLVEHFRRLDISTRFFEGADPGYADEFLRLFEWAYREHEAIRSSGRRFWTIDDRRRLFRSYAP